MLTADEFREELFKIMQEAAQKGNTHVDVNAGTLHRRLGRYPTVNHQMPVCCQVMKAAMDESIGDRVLREPESGQGASLTIRYVLPRPV